MTNTTEKTENAQKVVTFVKIQTGIFDVYVDGVKKDKWQIINGSLGLAGRDTRNVYGITRNAGKEDEKVFWLGSLQTCKKTVMLWVRKEGK